MAFSEKLGEAKIAITADTANLERGLEKAKSSISSTVASIQAKLSSVGKAITVGLTAPMLVFAKTSLSAWDKQEKAVAQVKAGLESTGNVAGETLEHLKELASDLQKNSLFGDEEILQKATATLLTFTKITKEKFGEAQQAAVNLAAKMNIDLQSAALQVGKALNDPIQGLNSLSRAGIQFTEVQKEQIKAMVEANDIAGAQAIILKELETQFGGAAKAAADAGTGPIQQLYNAFGDLQEVIGGIIAQYLPPLINLLKSLIEGFAGLSPTMQEAVVIGTSMVAMLGPLALALSAISAPVLAVGAALTSVYLLWKNWETIETIVIDTYEAVKKWLGDKLIEVLDYVGSKVRAVTDFFKDMWDKVVGHSYVPDMVDGIEDEFSRLDKVMVNPAEKATGKVADSFDALGKSVKDSTSDMMSDIGQSLGRSAGSGGKMDFSSVFSSFSGSIGRGIGSIFGGLFADGGRPPLGKVSVVGEKGPELFVPDSAGTIIPNGSSPVGGSITINQSINLMPDVGQAFKEQLAKSMPLIKRASVEAVAEAQARRGGSL